MNGRNEQVHILDHASGTLLASFGRPGHQLGNFTRGHTLAVDSKAISMWPKRIGAGAYRNSGPWNNAAVAERDLRAQENTR